LPNTCILDTAPYSPSVVACATKIVETENMACFLLNLIKHPINQLSWLAGLQAQRLLALRCAGVQASVRTAVIASAACAQAPRAMAQWRHASKLSIGERLRIGIG
jgi:hypothetical protein